MRSARDDYPTAAATERHPATGDVVREQLTAMFDELDRRRAWLLALPDDVALRLLDSNDP